MIPFIPCEISLGQYVCELIFGVNVFDLDCGIQIDSIEQPIKSNSVGFGNMSHGRAFLSLNDHLYHCFFVFKDFQQSFLLRRLDLWRNKINIIQIIDQFFFFCADESCEVENELHVCSLTSLSVLDYTDACFREELKQLDPINQERENRVTSILHPKRWFLILLSC